MRTSLTCRTGFSREQVVTGDASSSSGMQPSRLKPVLRGQTYINDFRVAAYKTEDPESPTYLDLSLCVEHGHQSSTTVQC